MALTNVQIEMVRAAAQAGRDAAIAASASVSAGIVLSVDTLNTVAMVQADGPNEAHGAYIVAPTTFFPGDRVLLMFTAAPPSCFVIGRQSGDMDEWHIVGTEGEPQFVTGWGHSAGTVPPSQNGNAQIMFTRRGGRVELRGRATLTSGSATNVFALPEAYWPDNDLLLPGQGALGAHLSVGIDMATGMVSVSGGTELVLDGLSYLARIQQG